MTRSPKPTQSPQLTRTRATPQIAKLGDAALVSVTGMIDERFPGFGDLTGMQTVVIDLAGVTFMTSFGVRQWLRSMKAVPPGVVNLYLVSCPTIIVDQLNMILNFGGRAKILSLAAPFVCAQCGNFSRETVDVLAERDYLAQGALAPRACKKCNGALEFDDIVESYFACLTKYGADSIDPVAAQLVANGATLKHANVETMIQPATTNPGEVGPSAVQVAAAEDASKRRSLIPFVVIIAVLGLVAAGVYVLVGPS